jgi:hypothetical protein
MNDLEPGFFFFKFSAFNDSDFEEVNMLGDDSGGSSNDGNESPASQTEQLTPECQNQQAHVQSSPSSGPSQGPTSPPKQAAVGQEKQGSNKQPAAKKRASAEERNPPAVFNVTTADADAQFDAEELNLVGEDDDDPFGGERCPCQCHDKDDPKLKARLRHCVTCGLKFVDGGVFVKVGKSIRPAKVSYIYRPPERSQEPPLVPKEEVSVGSAPKVGDLDSPSPKKAGAKKAR